MKVSDYLEKFYQDYNLGDEGGNHLNYLRIKVLNFFNIYTQLGK